MNEETTDLIASNANSRAGDNKIVRKSWSWNAGLIAALILSVAVWVGIEFKLIQSEVRGPVAALTLVLAVAATIGGATNSAPAQNVWLAVVVTVLIGAGVLVLDALFGIPFGQMRYTDSAGALLFGLIAWPMPFVWVVVVLNGRGIARLIMRPWRKAHNYGFWVMGIAAALAALFDLGLEVFASRINKFWVWQTRPGLPTWYGAPLVSFFSWATVTLLILGFATPVLLNKRTGGQQRRTSVQPLIIWLLLNGLFACGACAHGLWLAMAVIVVGNLVATLLAVRGATW